MKTDTSPPISQGCYTCLDPSSILPLKSVLPYAVGTTNVWKLDQHGISGEEREQHAMDVMTYRNIMYRSVS